MNMPVLSALIGCKHEGLYAKTGLHRDGWVSMDGIRDRISRAVLNGEIIPFDIQRASDIFWRGKRDNYDISSEFPGSTKLPFDSMWMEWSTPDVVKIKGKDIKSTEWYVQQINDAISQGTIPDVDISDEVIARYMAGNIKERHAILIGYDTKNESRILGMPFTVTSTHVIQLPACFAIDVDNSGNYISHNILLPDTLVGDETIYLNDSYGTMVILMSALALINCRNVSTSEAGKINYHKTAKQKRRREPDVKYRTIILPGHTTVSDSSSNARDIAALHRVRGHFKTFTEDKPLMGKHVGTYWWGWQVRGDSNNGVNVNDYRIK